MRRALLFLAAAVLSAVASDCAIENGANVGLYGQNFANHDQRSVLCTAAAGLVLVLAAMLVALLERLQVLVPPARDRDWLAEAAHDMSTKWSWRAFPWVFVVALLVRYVTESAELLQKTGHLAIGLGWLGGPLLIALAVHAVLCAVAFYGLALFMRGLDRTLQTLVSMMLAVLAALVTLLPNRPVLVCRDRPRAVFRSSPLSRHLGERGPPLLVAVTA